MTFGGRDDDVFFVVAVAAEAAAVNAAQATSIASHFDFDAFIFYVQTMLAAKLITGTTTLPVRRCVATTRTFVRLVWAMHDGYVPKKAVLVDDANHEMRTDANPQKQLTKTFVLPQ